MTFSTKKKALVAAALSAGLLAADAAVVSAQADSYRHRGYGYSHGYQRSAPAPYYGHRERRRDRTGEAVAAGVIGIGALIIGAAIADAARRDRVQQHSYGPSYYRGRSSGYDGHYED